MSDVKVADHPNGVPEGEEMTRETLSKGTKKTMEPSSMTCDMDGINGEDCIFTYTNLNYQFMVNLGR